MSAAESVIADLRVQNDLLTNRVAQYGQVTRGLAFELAAARRSAKQLRRQAMQLRQQAARLREENARLLARRRS